MLGHWSSMIEYAHNSVIRSSIHCFFVASSFVQTHFSLEKNRCIRSSKAEGYDHTGPGAIYNIQYTRAQPLMWVRAYRVT